MPLPKTLYEQYRAVADSKLVTTGETTEENLKEFANLLSIANNFPDDSKELLAEYKFTRGLYHSNIRGFFNFANDSRNRVAGLILWTDGKHIAEHFNLDGKVHLSWNSETRLYAASVYVARDFDEKQPANTKKDKTTKGVKSSRPRGPPGGKDLKKSKYNKNADKKSYSKVLGTKLDVKAETKDSSNAQDDPSKSWGDRS
jgi:hypothetical protein